MHRATPMSTSFRSYSAGGARSVVDKADDKKLMQESGGNFMKGETRSKIESPQNYGFTSVVMPADKGEDGKMSGAESFISFMGGNRSFPVATVMDDRRHRLKELGEGDSAMFRTKDDRQQFHLAKDGNFLSARDDRVNRMALVPKSQEGEQQSEGASSQQQAAGGEQGGKNKATGQKSALDDNKKSEVHIEQKGAVTTVRHKDGYVTVNGDDVTTYNKDKTISTQATENHVHIRFKDLRVWVDKGGCWSSVPILTRQDANCKG